MTTMKMMKMRMKMRMVFLVEGGLAQKREGFLALVKAAVTALIPGIMEMAEVIELPRIFQVVWDRSLFF